MRQRRVTLELNNKIIARANQIARDSQRSLEDVIEDWLDDYIAELPVEHLSDDEVIRLCDFQMNLLEQQELTNLLYKHREQLLTRNESERLDNLLQVHRRGLIRKARALQVAAVRGLMVK